MRRKPQITQISLIGAGERRLCGLELTVPDECSQRLSPKYPPKISVICEICGSIFRICSRISL
jgi:RNase P subunit RPR2